MASDLLIPDLNEIFEADVIKQIAENLVIEKNYSLTFYNQKLIKYTLHYLENLT